MQSLTVGDLRIEALQDEAAASMRLLWKGKSNNRHPSEALAPYFRSVLTTVATRRIPLELHFQKLEHINSSTLTTIIQLIQESRARSVKLVLVYDRELRWQKLSFDALRVFAKDELLELRAA